MPKLIKPDGSTQKLPDTLTFAQIQKLVGGNAITLSPEETQKILN